MVNLLRTDSANADFRELVVSLDRELRLRDGDDHAFYAQFNKIDSIGNVVVAYISGEPVGCGAFKKYSIDAAEIKRMFVRPEVRGKRIAAKVLNDLESWAAELGYRECVFETGLKQPEAIALYKREGYAVIPNYGQYAEVKNSVCMKKFIAIGR